MAEEMTTQFRVEGQPAFATENKENDNSSSSSEGEETNGDTTQSDGGENNSHNENKDTDKGFADHPRWKERENDWTKRFNDQETRHVSELQKLREEVEAKLSGLAPKADAAADAPVEVPTWFGGDEQQWKEFQKWNNSLLSEAEKRGAEKAMKGIEEKTTAEQKAIQEATDYFNSELATLESSKEINPKGIKIDRNKLLKFTIDNDLVDSKGRWNYKAAFRIMSGSVEQKSDTTDRKNLANATMSDGKPEAKPQPYTTSEDFSNPMNRPW